MWDNVADLVRKEVFLVAYGVVVIVVWWAGEQIYDKMFRR